MTLQKICSKGAFFPPELPKWRKATTLIATVTAVVFAILAILVVSRVIHSLQMISSVYFVATAVCALILAFAASCQKNKPVLIEVDEKKTTSSEKKAEEKSNVKGKATEKFERDLTALVIENQVFSDVIPQESMQATSEENEGLSQITQINLCEGLELKIDASVVRVVGETDVVFGGVVDPKGIQIFAGLLKKHTVLLKPLMSGENTPVNLQKLGEAIRKELPPELGAVICIINRGTYSVEIFGKGKLCVEGTVASSTIDWSNSSLKKSPVHFSLINLILYTEENLEQLNFIGMKEEGINGKLYEKRHHAPLTENQVIFLSTPAGDLRFSPPQL